jgi:hypothetical protein
MRSMIGAAIRGAVGGIVGAIIGGPVGAAWCRRELVRAGQCHPRVAVRLLCDNPSLLPHRRQTRKDGAGERLSIASRNDRCSRMREGPLDVKMTVNGIRGRK